MNGRWVDGNEQIEVTNPYSGEVIDSVPRATPADVDRAVSGLMAGAAQMRSLPAYDRFVILRRASELLVQRRDELGRLISQEEGKTLAEGRTEVARAADTIELSAEEARRLDGEVLPLDGAPGGARKLGFTLRVPCGIVAAISPFNFPLNLVCHKVGPALAAGNAVLIKPATDTPLSALKLVEILLQAGLPPEAIACVTGSGGAIGDAICQDHRVRKISFTGSVEVGRHICHIAGLKRVTMELGSNSPFLILDDADLLQAADAIATTGFANAGQVCISAQRVIALDSVYPDLVSAVQTRVAAIRYGDPLSPDTRMGPMIRERDAIRVESWIDEAMAGGAIRIQGGERQGSLLPPTVLAEVQPEMRISREEVFGPTVAITRAMNFQHALELANDTRFGLSAAIFTRDLQRAMQFAREVHSGNLHINWGPMWRADFMPYGGLKDSGMGKEGPRYAIHEMTEMKTVVIHGV